MGKKIFLLIGALLSFLVCIGSFTESKPEILFGYTINIWLVRAFWLLNTFVIFNAYRSIKHSEKE